MTTPLAQVPAEMPGRPGMRWDGRKLRSASHVEPLQREFVADHLADPANGERVLRCQACGVPETTEKLLTFALLHGGKPAGRFRVCQGCWSRANEPVTSDPLFVAGALREMI